MFAHADNIAGKAVPENYPAGGCLAGVGLLY